MTGKIRVVACRICTRHCPVDKASNEFKDKHCKRPECRAETLARRKKAIAEWRASPAGIEYAAREAREAERKQQLREQRQQQQQQQAEASTTDPTPPETTTCE